MSGLIPLSVLASLTGVSFLSVAERRDHLPTKVAAKLVAATAFVWHAYDNSATSCSRASLWIFCGLCCGFAGDMFLLSRRTAVFQMGVFAFLLNHLCYVLANLSMGVSADGMIAALPFVITGALAVWSWLRESVGDLAAAVAVYTVAIATMITTSAGALAAAPTFPRLVLLLASLVFFASDLLVAHDRFKRRDPFATAVNAPMYFGAQMLFGGFACVASAGHA